MLFNCPVGILGACLEAILAAQEVHNKLHNKRQKGQSAQEGLAGSLGRPETHPVE